MTAPIPDDIRAKVLAGYATGLTGPTLAKKYNVGLASVYRICNGTRAQRGRRYPDHVLNAAVQDYLDSGDSVRTTASRHPLSEDTLRAELAARELTRPSGATTPTRAREAALEDYIDGLSIARIAEKHGVARSTVSAWIKADGLTADDRQRGESPTDYTHGWVRDGLVWRPVKPVRGRAA